MKKSTLIAAIVTAYVTMGATSFALGYVLRRAGLF